MTQKYLKSSSEDLRAIFERSIVARDLAEPLASFDGEQSTERIILFMNEKEYDVVGIRQLGLVTGYASKLEISNGSIGSHRREFLIDDYIPETCSTLEVLHRLRVRDSRPLFVKGGNGHVWGIITRGDLQKAPFRMCLFGLITLLEMQLSKLIRQQFPNQQWFELLPPANAEEVERMFTERRSRNEGIDLADCMQFCHKKAIIKKSAELREMLEFRSNEQVERELKELNSLRNVLAHSQDILAGRWPYMDDIVNSAERLLKVCEEHTALAV